MTLEIATPKSVIVTGGRRHGVALDQVRLVSPNFVVTELGRLIFQTDIKMKAINL